jgi:hypothetical protein
MKKLIKFGGAAFILGLACAHGQATFNYGTANGVGVNDGMGNPVADNQLVLLIANESGSTGFNTLMAGSITPGGFLDGSYQILDIQGTFNFGTPGSLGNEIQLNYTGTYQNLQAGDQLAVVWFTDVSSNSTVLTAGNIYGLYTENDATWQAPSANGEADLTIPGGQDANMTTTSLSAVPEPSTYALIVGAAALLFAAWRRRQSRTSNLA